jgi:ADP-heptose:LPS heptosyltransferase
MVEEIKILKKDTIDLFIFPYGIDDFLVFTSVLKKYKEDNPNNKIFLLVSYHQQPAFVNNSYIKELALCYNFIDFVQEMKEVVIIKDNRLIIDKKRIEWYVKYYSRFVKFNKKYNIEINARIKRDDYRFNIYFQYLTTLGYNHHKPVYILPEPTEKAKKGSELWLKNNNIREKDKIAVLQLSSRFPNKNVDKKLFDVVSEKYNLKNYKIIEMNSSIIEGSLKLSPEEVSNITTIEIIKKADIIVSNVSYAYQIGGILNKKTVAIVNPEAPPIIRDYNFNFDTENIVYFAQDKTLQEWELIKAEVPFVGENNKYENIEEVKLEEINIYNPRMSIGRLPKIVIEEKEKIKKEIAEGKKILPPLIWYKQDIDLFHCGGNKEENIIIKYQALEGISTLLAYKELDYKTIPVKITNIYKPFHKKEEKEEENKDNNKIN